MRIQEVQKRVQAKELDAYLGVENANYLSGTSAATLVVVIPEKSVLLCKRLELDRAKRESKIDSIRAFVETKVPLRKSEDVIFGGIEVAVGEVLNEFGAEKIGYDRLSQNTLESFNKKYEAEYERIPDLIWDLRKIKTKKELEFMKKSADIARMGMERAKELMEPGRTEIEAAAEAEYVMRKSGSEGPPFNTIVASGRNSRFPHGGSTKRELRRRDLVIVDLGATFKGYKSDMSRTFAISPSSKQKKILKFTRDAYEKALQSIGPEISARGIDQRVRGVFREAGYEEFCLHGSGHGIGLDVHELPDLASHSEDVLEEGMVVTIEPGLYVNGVGGTRIEDMIAITRDGYEILTRA